MAWPELYFEKFLGKGSFGSVSLFKGQRDGETFYAAVKTSDDKHAESLYREFQILSEFKGRCSRIVQCYGNRVQEERLNYEGCSEYKIAMEYAPGGSLRSFINNFKDQKIPDPLIRKFTRMLLEGLATIHRHGYVHCDLKPGNILVFPKNGPQRSSYELKISDFGLSRRDGDSSWWRPHRPYAGTPIYMSPESVTHGETGKGLDLWSLGCVVLEMYTGKKPWWHKNYDLEDLKICYEPLIPSDLPFDAKLFLMTCFAPETEHRKDALTLLRHIFLGGDFAMDTEDASTLLRHSFLPLPVNVKNTGRSNIALDTEDASTLLRHSFLPLPVNVKNTGRSNIALDTEDASTLLRHSFLPLPVNVKNTGRSNIALDTEDASTLLRHSFLPLPVNVKNTGRSNIALDTEDASTLLRHSFLPLPVNVKNTGRSNIALEIEKIEQRLSKIMGVRV